MANDRLEFAVDGESPRGDVLAPLARLLLSLSRQRARGKEKPPGLRPGGKSGSKGRFPTVPLRRTNGIASV
jgi:hypothetical protein